LALRLMRREGGNGKPVAVRLRRGHAHDRIRYPIGFLLVLIARLIYIELGLNHAAGSLVAEGLLQSYQRMRRSWRGLSFRLRGRRQGVGNLSFHNNFVEGSVSSWSRRERITL
jgi:hypothetical protein